MRTRVFPAGDATASSERDFNEAVKHSWLKQRARLAGGAFKEAPSGIVAVRSCSGWEYAPGEWLEFSEQETGGELECVCDYDGLWRFDAVCVCVREIVM